MKILSTAEHTFLPVILGGDVGVYSIARSFHQAYHMRSTIVCTAKILPTAYSAFIDPVYAPGLEKKEVLLQTLSQVAKAHPDRQLLLIGCGDWYVRMIIENKSVLKDDYIIPYIDEEVMERVVLKDKFYEICDELDIPHPKTYVYECGKENDLRFDFDYPVIAKPANSALYHYAEFPGKRKVFKFDREEQLRAMLDQLESSSYDYKFLIQDFIPGDDTGMRILTCYSDQHGKVKFASFGHCLLEEHGPGAIGNPVGIITEVQTEIIRQAKRFLEHVGYVGFSNFDIKYDPRDGSYNFFEINIRLGRSNFYVTAGGFNPVVYLVDDYIYHQPITPCIADKEHLYLVVPKGILLRYIKDDELKARVKRLIKAKQYTNPYIYKEDRGLMRRIHVWMMLLNYYRKYHRYG